MNKNLSDNNYAFKISINPAFLFWGYLGILSAARSYSVDRWDDG
jgi:hypothetical protein